MSPKFNIAPLRDWPIDTSFPFIISGPCSAESESQVLATAHALKATGKVSLLRAGIWKPRTRPNSFEGVGAPGLEWLMRAKKETGLPVTTEVAKATHVEACLKAGVDVLWIGARTTVNPFSVQEIADALQGVDIPVIVKNPINPDLQLWIGALERLQLAGIHQLMAMHRGFSSSQKSVYRNDPMWEIPIALMSQHPEVPIICDPSHISGKRELLLPVAQKAFDLGMLGVMIESHPNPEIALSDKEQQVVPARFQEIIESIHFRRVHRQDINQEEALATLRSRIDEIDKGVIQLLFERMEVAAEIGKFKKKHDITILQLERWIEIFNTRSEQALDLGFSKEFITNYLEQLHKESIRKQTEVMNSNTD